MFTLNLLLLVLGSQIESQRRFLKAAGSFFVLKREMFEKKKQKNRADLLQALRGYRCGMVREQDKRIKTGIWGFWQATEGSVSFWNEENGGDLKMENRKNHADLLQALRGYRGSMVREQGKRIKTGIWRFWQAIEGDGSLIPENNRKKSGKYWLRNPWISLKS